jgi:hypothetical protein
MRRWLVRLGTGAVVLVVLLVVAAKLILRTSFATDRVAAQIQKAVGGAPVKVDSLDVGLGACSTGEVQFREDGVPADVPPWAVISSVEADVSLLSLIRGDLSGGPITLLGPKLAFRLDQDNKLLTKLPDFSSGGPSTWSEFQIKHARIAFQRKGGPDAVFSDISGRVRRDGDRVTISGAADDSQWGRWTISGERSDAQAPLVLTMHSDSTAATADKLRRVPFVPPTVWEQVTFEGETPVDLTLQFGGSVGMRYRVAFAPRDAIVRVPSADLVTRSTTGKVLVEDGVVSLAGINGKVAGGSLHVTRSDMDFRGEASRLTIQVSANRLNLRDLPPKWHLPAVDGRMSGRAELTLAIEKGEVQTSGGGTGTIEGFLSQTVNVQMVADKGGYRFDIEGGKQGTVAPGGTQAAAPAPGPEFVSEIFGRVLSTGMVAVQPAAPEANKAQAGQSIRLNLGLKDVSLRELVQKLNLKVPIRLDGRLNIDVHATIPLGDARNLNDYQATGTVDLPWAHVEDLWLQQVHAKVTLENGVLRLNELSARGPNTPPAAPPAQLLPGGTLTGTAELGVAPAGDLSADLKVAALPLGPLLRLVPSANFSSVGAVDGEMRFRAPAGALKDITKWEGSGKLSGRDLRVRNVPADRFTADVELHGGRVAYKVKGETLGGTFDIDGQYPSPPPVQPSVPGHVHIHNIDLSRLADALRFSALRPLSGRFDFDTPLGLPSVVLADNGQAQFSNLGWGGKRIADRIVGDVRILDGAVRVESLSGSIAGGTVGGRLAYDFRHPERSFILLTGQRLDARTLFAPFVASPPLDGPIDVRVVGHRGQEWHGMASVVLATGKLFGLNVRGVLLPFAWGLGTRGSGEIRLHDASADLARGRMTGNAELRWGETARLTGQIVFNGIDVGELASHYSSSQAVRGFANGRIDLGGQEMRSVKDLTARMRAELRQTVASQAPVFQQVLPMILPGVGTNVQFQSGEFRGTLGAGVVHIERLTLVGDLARIFAEGTVTLQQRLDVNVIANTNQLGIDPAALRLLGVTLPAVGPIPLGAVNQAVSYLANQTISLRVTGTIKAPSVQISPAPLLTQAAVRFFVNQAGVPLPSAAVQMAPP